VSELLEVSFAKGMQEAVESSNIPDGFGARIVNWRPDQAGGLRVRTGWSKTGRNGLIGAISRGRGIGVFQTSSLFTGAQVVQVGTSSGWDDTSSTVTVTWPGETSNGSLLLLCVEITQVGASGPASASVSGWGSAVVSQATGNSSYAAIWAKTNAAAESGSVSVTFTRGTGATKALGRAFLLEISGVQAVSPTDRTATGNAYNDPSGSLAGTYNIAVGASTKQLQTSLTSSLTQPVELGVMVAGAHRSSATPILSLLLFPSGISWPDFMPISGWSIATDYDGRSAEAGYAVSASSMANTGAVMVQMFSTTGGVQGDALVTNADFSIAPAAAIATFKAQVETVTKQKRTFVIAQDNGYAHELYATDGNTLSSKWVQLTTIVNGGPGDPVAFASGMGVLMATCARWDDPWEWSGSGAGTLRTEAPAGRAIAFHKNRFFIGGSIANPTRLAYSKIGDRTDWTADGGYIEVGLDDGEPILELLPSENGLMIGKESSLWVLTGSGIDSFVLTRLPGGNVAPGRTLCQTPYGVVAVGQNHVYLVGSDAAEVISGPIENTYGMTGTYMSAAYLDDAVYICDAGSGRIFIFDFKTGAWSIEEVSDSGESPNLVTSSSNLLVALPGAADSSGPIAYRRAPTATRLKDYDPLSETFYADTGEMWPFGPMAKFTPRHLHMKLRQREGFPDETPLIITPYYDGEQGQEIRIEPQETAGVYRKRIDLGLKKSVSSIRFVFSHTPEPGDSALFDLEQAILEYLPEPTR
jgi:hypothetical protein